VANLAELRDAVEDRDVWRKLTMSIARTLRVEGTRWQGTQWRRYLWGIWARAPSSFENSVHSAAAASLTVQISKITKEKNMH